MLEGQIMALEDKELQILMNIESIDLALKKAKNDLTIIKRAKQSLKRLEEQLDEQINIPE